MARGGSRVPRENVPPPRDVSPAVTAKIKLKSKQKQWKPLDLGDHNILDFPNVDLYEDDSAYSEGDPTTTVGSSSMAARLAEDDEILIIFPKGLPDPIYLRSEVGNHHGEIQYIKHPNRDVTAHQWSATYFEWIVIGCYSCVRKTIEGPVVSPDFLKLIGSTRERPSSLEYFCELAEEYGKSVHAEPSNFTVASSRPGFKTNTAEELRRHDQIPIVAGPSTKDDDFPVLGSLALKNLKPNTQEAPPKVYGATKRPQSEEPPRVPTPLRLQTFRDDNPFVEAPTAPRGQMDRDFRFPSPNVGRTKRDVRDSPPPRPEASMDQSRLDRKVFFIQQERDHIQQLRQAKQQQVSAPPDPEELVKGLQSVMPLQQIRSSVQELNPSRERMLDYLNRVGDEFKSTQKVAQTPAYDSPVEPHPTGAVEIDFASEEDRTPVPRVLNSFLPTSTVETVRPGPMEHPPGFHLQPSQNAEAGKCLTSSGSQFSRKDLHTSDPEPGYEGRLVDVYNTSAASEALPTPQNFGGPFFYDDMPSASNPTARTSTRMSYGERLDKWWTSGNLSQRHDEYLKALAKTSKNEEAHKDFVVTDRALLPLYETFSSYVRDIEKKKKGVEKVPDHFMRFASPPDFAIDRSRDGNKSFFGEDWGEVPKRIGRDPRYFTSSVAPVFVPATRAPGQPAAGTNAYGLLSTGPGLRGSAEDLGKLKGFGSFGDAYRSLPRGPSGGSGLQSFGFGAGGQGGEM
ncbi:uncharacterized protein K452DRAFT_109813 [Aplosporella prunicola CBS 121167]|uniref:Uncharacterized protein n=1 Tax=Aplosporella prunicola CBS 121167 TaxID=1176127 RepID=A0A6A6BUP3_9PEZI|nr:uncharacterized protein K452DRAFT_109813 [Aplosporella prunicola CBS 121167]KAF2146381.1 hypothetical protein K452DRAFT_109813 [Aplosporella prunicola CBS 121167]